MGDFLSGFNLNDLGQTAVDIISAQNTGPITSAGPKTNPAATNAAAMANATQKTVNPTNYTPFIIGGAALVGVLVLVVVLARR
jgi:hypothetical protein